MRTQGCHKAQKALIWLSHTFRPQMPRDYRAMTLRFIAELPQECHELYNRPWSLHDCRAAISYILSTYGWYPSSRANHYIRAINGSAVIKLILNPCINNMWIIELIHDFVLVKSVQHGLYAILTLLPFLSFYSFHCRPTPSQRFSDFRWSVTNFHLQLWQNF